MMAKCAILNTPSRDGFSSQAAYSESFGLESNPGSGVLSCDFSAIWSHKALSVSQVERRRGSAASLALRAQSSALSRNHRVPDIRPKLPKGAADRCSKLANFNKITFWRGYPSAVWRLPFSL